LTQCIEDLSFGDGAHLVFSVSAAPNSRWSDRGAWFGAPVEAE
jgi:hypothetical protein